MTTTSPAPSVGARTSSIPRSRLAGRRTGCGLEDLAGHRSVDHERCDDAGATQAGDEGGGAPVPLRCRVDQALAPRTPALAADHGGRRTRLVEDDKGGGAHGALPDPPALASGGDVRSILFAGLERLFFAAGRGGAASSRSSSASRPRCHARSERSAPRAGAGPPTRVPSSWPPRFSSIPNLERRACEARKCSSALSALIWRISRVALPDRIGRRRGASGGEEVSGDIGGGGA
jgi:hypothetical protein